MERRIPRLTPSRNQTGGKSREPAELEIRSPARFTMSGTHADGRGTQSSGGGGGAGSGEPSAAARRRPDAPRAANLSSRSAPSGASRLHSDAALGLEFVLRDSLVNTNNNNLLTRMIDPRQGQAGAGDQPELSRAGRPGPNNRPAAMIRLAGSSRGHSAGPVCLHWRCRRWQRAFPGRAICLAAGPRTSCALGQTL